jgi:transposase
MHYAELQDEKGNVLWHVRFENSGNDLESILQKMRKIEESNSRKVEGVFMNPTGNYHVQLKYFLEKNGFIVYMVDARKTVHLRKVMNLNAEKSDPEDAHILASIPWYGRKYMERPGHVQDSLSEITWERDMIRKNITRITNCIHGDLAAVFPEFPDLLDVDSSAGIAILEEYSTPDVVARTGPDKVLKIMHRAGRNHYSLEDASRIVDAAKNTIGIPNPEGVYRYRISTNARRLKNEISEMKGIENEIKSRSSGNEGIKHLTDLKDMGPMNSAIIVSEIGNIDQFDSALKLESYGWKCPDMTGSGGRSYPKGITRVRNAYLINAAYENAASLVVHRNTEF